MGKSEPQSQIQILQQEMKLRLTSFYNSLANLWEICLKLLIWVRGINSKYHAEMESVC